jgi:glycosyltransferase involved in cell wall biosynthesis
MRATHGWGEKNFLFGILGRITPLKGQKEFVKAAAIVARQIPEARFLVIGSPAPGDEAGRSYQRELEELVRGAALDKCVFFYPFQTSIRDYIESLDAVVNASVGPEGLPQSLIEAMFLSKPVIAPGQGGIPELVEDSVTGLLYRPVDEMTLARRMLDLVRSPELVSQLGKCARNHVLEKFSRARFHGGVAEELALCLSES